MGQDPRAVRRFPGPILPFVAVLVSLSCSGREHPGASGPARPAGTLVVSYRNEPRSFNRYAVPQSATELFTRLTQAPLVRLNRATRQPEPWLAAGWKVSEDAKTWTLTLRDDVRFSDGAPFTSADVLFSFQAIYDPRLDSPLGTSVRAGGEPLTVRALDERTIVISLAAPAGAGVALLDTLPIYPRHTLKAALDAGTFADAWGTSAPLTDLAGLGPYVLKEHTAGQRLLFVRNPHYWRKDDGGRALPYLDAIEVQIIPDANGEMLRLQAGELDLVTDYARAEDLAALRTLSAAGKIALMEPGISVAPEFLLVNQLPGAAVAKGRPWLQREELRQAISAAVDRQAIVNTVYLGAAEPVSGPITPGHGDWYVPGLPNSTLDRARAGALLDRLGLIDRNGDGARDDASGRTARIALLTQKGHTVRERTAAVIQEQLRQVGLTIDLVSVDVATLNQRIPAGDFDAFIRGVLYDTFEPASDFWLSSGQFHIWNPGQKTPATPWEAEIDRLMKKQSTTTDLAEQRRTFAEAQRILAEHQPVIYFAAPKLTVPASTRLRGAAASVLALPVLWNADVLTVDAGRR